MQRKFAKFHLQKYTRKMGTTTAGLDSKEEIADRDTSYTTAQV